MASTDTYGWRQAWTAHDHNHQESRTRLIRNKVIVRPQRVADNATINGLELGRSCGYLSTESTNTSAATRTNDACTPPIPPPTVYDPRSSAWKREIPSPVYHLFPRHQGDGNGNMHTPAHSSRNITAAGANLSHQCHLWPGERPHQQPRMNSTVSITRE